MKEHPILFSGEMVRAILALEKTQTRRLSSLKVINENPSKWLYCGLNCDGNALFHPWDKVEPFSIKETIIIKCPYGRVGDHLWVRETFMFKKGADCREMYVGTEVEAVLGDPPHYLYKTDKEAAEYSRHFKWRPSIHMPRKASRITLLVTGIRVERLQEISEADARAEGVKQVAVNLSDNTDVTPYRKYYRQLWDRINGKKHPWESNPWVWVIEFAVWDDKSAAIPEGAEAV